MREIRRVGLLGTGVIGSGWAARALHAGIDVLAFDIDPKRQVILQQGVVRASDALDKLTENMPLPPKGTLNFTTELTQLAKTCDYIQESVPEVLEVKHAVLGPLAKEAPEDVVIASSTSGFMPSELQEGMLHPERIIIGHPFNPVYLCPLVEIVGSRLTSIEIKEHAAQFYRSIGMHALQVRKEVPGHLSDRLQEAMWREILHALNDDIATTGELDESIVYGPGLRWAIMGMNQIYMMGGGQGGARHFIKQFGPALKWPWSHLEAPELTDDIIDRFVEGTAVQADGKSVAELETIRDECLVAIQKVLAKHNMGAGRTLNEFEAHLASKAKGQGC